MLVDFSPDDVATFVAQNFPKRVEITPGQTVVFKQTWTGEPHTVTGGLGSNDKLKKAAKFIDFFNGYESLASKNEAMVNPEGPTGAAAATFADFARELQQAKPAAEAKRVVADYDAIRKLYPDIPALDSNVDLPFSEFDATYIEGNADKALDGIPFAADDNLTINQNIGQKCFLSKGAPPEDASTPCTRAQQAQPAFNGTQSFYNSGILPYEGTRGNTFRVNFAKSTPPGSYFFYCAIHGPGQLSEIVVNKPGSDVKSASAVAREGRAAATDVVASLAKTFHETVRTNKLRYHGETLRGPFAGLPVDVHGSINEFVPNTLRAKANEAITWKVAGGHTISFNVPPYLPIVEFGAKQIRLNPKVRNAAGGAPKPGDAPEDGPLKIDGGTYNGVGFWSSGVVEAQDGFAEYTLRITKKGTYPYACLIHPKMIGKVIIT